MYYKISNGSVTLGANTILEDINFYVIFTSDLVRPIESANIAFSNV